MPPEAAGPRMVVLREARLTLQQAAARIDRLIDQLDPSLPDDVGEVSYAQGLLRIAVQTLGQPPLTSTGPRDRPSDGDRHVHTGTPASPPATPGTRHLPLRGWFG